LSYNSSKEFHFTVEERKSPWIKIGAIVCAVAVTGSLLLGYFILQRRHKQQALAAQQAAQAAKQHAPIEAEIFENEARIQGGDALIGGVVRNISNARIDDLNLEIQLIPRAGEGLKVQQVKLEPVSLNPGEEGRYALTIPSHQWSATRIVRLFSARRKDDIAFKSELGERRPLETPQGVRVVVVPKQNGKDNGFLNTPDTPIPIH
jgi:hypothetical protein